MKRTSRIKRWTKRILLTILTLALLGLAGAYGFVYFDLWSEASNLENERATARRYGLPLNAEDMKPEAVPEAKNAAPLLRKSFGLLEKAGATSQTIGWVTEAAFEPSGDHLEEASQLLSRLREPLDLGVRASTLTHCDFGYDWSQGAALAFPEFANGKNLAKILAARGLVRVRQSQVDEGLADIGAASRIGVLLAKPKTLIGLLVAIALDSIAVRAFEVALTHRSASAGDVAKIAYALESLPNLPPLQHSLQGEVFFASHFSRNLDREFDFFAPPESEYGERLTRLLLMPPLVPSNFRSDAYQSRLLSLWNRAWARIEGERDPLVISRVLQDSFEFRSPPLRPTRILERIVFPVFAQVGDSVARDVARRASLLEASRVVGYRARYGAFPTTWAPTAADPYADGVLQFKSRVGGFAVYSVGSNRVDDGGAIRYTDREPRFRDVGVEFPFRFKSTRPIGTTPSLRTAEAAPTSPASP